MNSWKWLLLFVGIDVKKGRGRYIDTCMVIFAPRYLLDNKSSHKLAFAQREFARGQVSRLLLKNDQCLFNSTVGFNAVIYLPINTVKFCDVNNHFMPLVP